MVERRRRPRFLHESPDALRIAHQMRGKDLHRDVTAKERIDRVVDRSHPSGSQQGKQLVTPYFPA